MILAGEQARFVWVRDNFEGEAASEKLHKRYDEQLLFGGLHLI